MQNKLWFLLAAFLGSHLLFFASGANAFETSYKASYYWYSGLTPYKEYRQDGQDVCNYNLTGTYTNNSDSIITTTFSFTDGYPPIGKCSWVYNNGQAPATDSNIYAVPVCPNGGMLTGAGTADNPYMCKVADPYTVLGRKGANLGPTCSTSGAHSCGQPINTGNGNMWHTETDYQDRAGGDLSFSRTYNSLFFTAYEAHSMGLRWTNAYDASLRAIAPSSTLDDQLCYKWVDSGQVFCETTIQPFIAGSAPSAIQVLRGDGKRYVFNLSGTNYVGAADTNDRLSAIYDLADKVVGFQYNDAARSAIERYDALGRLLSITARNGAVRRLSYSDGTTNDTSVGRYPADAPHCSQLQDGAVQPFGRLLCVTDDWGRQLNFQYDSQGRIREMKDPVGHSNLYEYDGPSGGCSASTAGSVACSANNLTKVTYSDGASRQYAYNESAYINKGAACANAIPVGDGFGHLPNSMTGLIDENGKRYISWNYNCIGYATQSELAGNVEQVSIAYSLASDGTVAYAQVTSTQGDPAAPQTTTSKLTQGLFLGVAKNRSIDKACVVCGQVASRNYDENGNVTVAYDFRGSVSTYTFDKARNLETSRTEAYNTSAVRVITTAWHPTLRVPLKIAEPKLITTFTYDEYGNVLSRSLQSTTDQIGTQAFNAPTVGAARTWMYTYDKGQLTSITAPRTDVVTRTVFAYDSNGNLASSTNALGQTTTYSDYDLNGNVGKIQTPDGVTTELTYSARGLLRSRTVSGAVIRETSTYDYDQVGQLIRKTNPDGSWAAFAYDDAHRLIAMSDNLGDSVTYKLDLMGNRLSEQVKDPDGLLTRQVTRVFDGLNRLQQITGAAQ
jgi:YD repeat-containing protein